MTSPPSKRTLSDKLVDQGLRRLAKKLELEYEQSCPHKPACNAWFEQLGRAELKLHELLAKRPVSRAEIGTTCDRAFRSLRGSLREKKQQPRYRQCTSISTGEVHLIPDYE